MGANAIVRTSKIACSARLEFKLLIVVRLCELESLAMRF
jgi:hypothetical protein